MQVLEIRTLRGPNVFHHKPILIMKVDLQDLAEVPSSDVEGFTNRLLDRLPGLWEHRCSPGKPGGFVERLRRGTYPAHMIEHVALELSSLAGMEVGFGKTVFAGQLRTYSIAIRFTNEEAMKYLLKESVRFVEALMQSQDFDVNQVVRKARRLKEDTDLGPTTKAIVEAAERREIPWRRIGHGNLIELGYGVNRRRIQTAVSDSTSLIAADLVQDKSLTNEILADASLPVPKGFRASSMEDVDLHLHSLRAPYVVKPIDGHHGQGVVLDLHSVDEVKAACEIAWKYSDEAIIEECCRGLDYRVLVVGGRVVAVSERTPAHVIGDGESTVARLVDKANLDPRRGDGHSNLLTRIEIEDTALACLQKQNLELSSIPELGRKVLLRQTANLSTGGTAKDLTDELHPTLRSLCERAARITGLDICGIDLIHEDATRPVNETTRIIEVNAGPGLRMHLAPSEGRARDVGSSIIDHVYPHGTSARIPIVSVTGTNGKTTVSRLIAHILERTNKCVGLTCSDGIMIGGEMVEKGDTTGPRSARVVLSDSSVEVAVLETARGGLLRNGLGYDWSDVGVITNIRPDHIGQDGIERLSDLVRVKSLVVERVREGGTIVLNAEDREAAQVMQTMNISDRARRIVYYALDANHPLVVDHLRSGGCVFVVSEGYLVELAEAECTPIVSTQELGFAFDGTASFHVSNALAAAAAAKAMGCTSEQIAQGLRTFRSNLHNMGRTNVYRVGAGYALLDYGHNPDAICAIGKMIRNWNVSASCAVIGLPGDRADDLHRESARAAALSFDRLVLRDDTDRRGRKQGEIPQLINSVIEEIHPGLNRKIVFEEGEAVEEALRNVGVDEVVVIFYDDFETTMAALRQFDPIPLETFPFIQRPGSPSIQEIHSIAQASRMESN